MPSDDTHNQGDNRVPGARMSLFVIGPVSVSVGDQVIPIGGRKARAVLAYLALTEGLRESRERLVGLLWSEFSEDKARVSLRQSLHELRRHLDPAQFRGLHTERLIVRLDRALIDLDLWQMLERAEAREVQPLLRDKTSLTEQLMQDLEDVDPAFRVWVLAKRQNVHERLSAILTDGLRDTKVSRPGRRRIAAALLNLDPTHEEACRALMLACAEEGDAAAALRAYNALWEILAADYDMEPSEPTQQLVAEIKQGHFDHALPELVASEGPSGTGGFHEGIGQLLTPPSSSPPRGGSPLRVALVVESFPKNGIDANSDYLVDGFRHNLIAGLVRFREWLVADGERQPNPEVAAGRVAATYSLSATAYLAGSAINLVLMLSDRASGFSIWTDRVQVSLDSWFDLQQKIIRQIAVSLNIHLSKERLNRLASGTDGQRAVYDHWLRGQEIINKFSPEHWDQAKQICDEMIAQAPDFSPAFSTLVQMNNSVHISHPGLRRDPVLAARTQALARKAVELDSVDSRAQLCLGWSFAMAKQYRPAAVHVGLAVDLNPNDPWTLVSSALFNAFVGDGERAEALWRLALDAALALRTVDWGYRVSIAFLSGDYEGTLDATDLAADAIKTLPAWRAAALHHLGRQAEAEAEAQRFLEGIRGNWHGAESASDEAIGRWLLHLYPIAQADAWERLRAGVIGAGIPSGGIRHHDW